MTSGPDERLLRLAEGLLDGGPIDWDEVKRRDPDLAATLERLRELEAIGSAHQIIARNDGSVEIGDSMRPREQPLFSWGKIQVLEKVGEGGFAEVYRAWDPALEREVALKLSRSGMELAATGIQRWLDEARRLARIRHSNVLVVHGVDVRDGRAGFWTDLIQGRTLEKVLEEQGRLGGAEATLIGLDLCRALAAVHAAGLVHGDLKASNVMREGHRGSTAEPGRIVLTDFGASSDSSTLTSRSSTFVTPLTSAPEVLRGEPPTPASDLYSLGVLLYRLLTARYPIESNDLAELEANIQYGRRTPLRDLRPDLGGALVTVVERALDPDAARRFSSAGTMERALSEAFSAESVSARESTSLHGEAGAAEREVRAPLSGGSRALRAVAAISMVLVVAVIGWWATKPSRPPKPGPIHFEFRGVPNKLVRADPNQFAISPDGTTLAFIAVDSTGSSLWAWHLGKNDSRELERTQGAKHPFWSPDGKQIGFFADGKMQRVPLDGGDPEVICDAPQSHGATWGRKGVIVFAPESQGPLYRVSAFGGAPEVTTPAPDTTRGMNAHAWPSFLPDGEHFLYIERRSEPSILAVPPARPGPWTSYVGSIRSGRAEPVLVANSAAMFAAPHYLVFIRDGVLLAQDFDMHRRRLKGHPVRIADSPDPVAFFGTRCGSASANGVLVWRSGGGAGTRLAWIDRSGRRTELGGAHERWTRGTISPDGRRAVLRKEEANGGSSLWVRDLEREVATPLTSGPAPKDLGAWSPDSKEIVYSSRGPGGVCDLYRIAVDRPESDRLFYRSTGRLQNAFGWSRDGRWVLVQDSREGSGLDLFMVPAQGGAPRPYLATRFNESRAHISPDGKWVVYLSDEAGPLQAYVGSFPTLGERQQVSTAPLLAAKWAKQGREILLFAVDYRVLSVPVETGKGLRLGAAQELFRMPTAMKWIDPAPDGQRFLLFEPAGQPGDRSIAVNVNWTAGLKP